MTSRWIVAHLRGLGGEALVSRALSRSGVARPPAELLVDGGWTTYDELRALAEAAAELLGGTSALRAVGARLWTGPGASPGLLGTLQAMGTPEELLARIDDVVAITSTVVHADARQWGSRHWEVRHRLVPGFEPFRAYCDVVAGLYAEIPVIFGQPRAEVAEVDCQVDGAPECRFALRWPTAGEPGKGEADALRQRVVVLEARFSALQDTVGGLVSGESLETTLAHVVEAAARTVVAPGFVLALEEVPAARRRLYWDGMDQEAARRVADDLVAGSGPASGSSATLVVDVASTRQRYGRLVAVRGRGEWLPHERATLTAYGRLAAAALDSATAVEEARRQAGTATALLELSTALARIGTTDEVAQRLARAVPAVVDCDRVVVALRDPERGVARVTGVHGHPHEAEQRLRDRTFRVPVDDGLGLVLHLAAPSGRGLARVLAETGAAAGATVPIVGADRQFGWVSAIVVDHPERLSQQDRLGERLAALAGQAATAIANAELLDQVRHQALHDPLTGLANQRLLREQARAAIAQAARNGERVGLVFCDLDRFKVVNDTWGHGVGDQLLCQVADRLVGAVRASDVVARFGGDEFVVLLPRLTDDGGAVVGAITAALSEPFEVDGLAVPTGTSIGLSVYPDEAHDLADLLRRADAAMYAAKVARRRERATLA